MVSVIIPSYNREKAIKQSIDSVLNQTITDIEIIVVDDGSTDNTEKIIKSINDSRLRYIKLEKNCGACVARNRGIKEAKGEYIAFQDSDDTWVMNKLERQQSFINETNADMVYCGMNRHINNKVRYYPSDQKSHEDLSLKMLLTKNKVSTQNIFIKTDVAKKIMFDPSFKRLQDWDFATRVLLSGFRVKYLAEPLVDAVVQQDSITASVNAETAYKHFINKYETYYQQFPDALSEVYYTLGFNLINVDRIKARYYFMNSLKLRFRIKSLLRLLKTYIG